MRNKLVSPVCVTLLGSLALLSVAEAATKGILVDWTIRLQLQTQNLSDYFGSHQKATIIREDPAEDFTSYSLILPSDCNHTDCTEAFNNCSLTPSASQVTKLVMKSTEQRIWVVECSLFAKVDIPVSEGGLPGRRLSGPDRGRGLSSVAGTEEANPASVLLGVKTPVVISYNSNGTKLKREKMTEHCNQLRKENLTTFHQECCLNNQVSDPRCALNTLFNAYQEQREKEISSTVTIRTTVENPFSEHSPGEKDVSRLGKALDLDEEVEEGGNKTEESKSQEKVENISSWKSKYFTVLGFLVLFLVLLAIFVIVILALIYKIKKSKAWSAPVSPGAGLSVSRASRSRQGYSSVVEEDGDEGVPLTPATEQAQAFQY